ncbi:DUF6796 family protein [Haloferax sp. ATB1]|uniref:DUF6796 family protein n=1 Tax=Haloferax sp. ATB1 TaxID=1508454 RepID=UPI0005B20EC5|nr:DUF6796 family protein [Haloferax sp. ATB1]
MTELTNTEHSSSSIRSYVDRNKILLAGLLGVVGNALGVVADLASGYSLEGAANVTTAFSVLSLQNLSLFLASKPPSQVVFGHYLAILGIPLGLFGLWQVYQAIRPAGWLLSRTAWFVGVFTYIIGTVFHSTFAFITFGIQAADTVPPAGEQTMRTMLDRFALVFELLAVLMVAGLVVALGLIFVAIAFRETHYPRWFALANPLFIQGVTGAVAYIAPLEARIFLIVTAYNLSLVVFFALSTVLLRNSRLHTRTTPRIETV